MSLTPNEHVVTHTWPLRSGDPTCALLAGPSPLGGWGWVVSASETFGEFVWASLTDSATFSGAELLSWSPDSFGATVACVVSSTEAMVGKTRTCWSSCSAEETEVIYRSSVLPSHMTPHKAGLFTQIFWCLWNHVSSHVCLWNLRWHHRRGNFLLLCLDSCSEMSSACHIFFKKKNIL